MTTLIQNCINMTIAESRSQTFIFAEWELTMIVVFDGDGLVVELHDWIYGDQLVTDDFSTVVAALETAIS